MARNRSVTVRLTPDEYEWLRRKAYWDGTNLSATLRARLHALIREEGYLRPPDEEEQDFGYEKEMIEFVRSLSSEA